MESVLWVDIEGFSGLWKTQNGKCKAICLLGEMYFIVYHMGKRYADKGKRVFAHAHGDGIYVTIATDDAKYPVDMAVQILQHVLCHGGLARAAISQGQVSDISGCYPEEVQQANGKFYPGKNGGCFEIYLTSVMGSGFIKAHELSKNPPKGPCILLDAAFKDSLPAFARRIPDADCYEIDWINTVNLTNGDEAKKHLWNYHEACDNEEYRNAIEAVIARSEKTSSGAP